MGALRYNLALVVSNILFGVSFSVYVSLLHGPLHPSQLFSLQLLFSLFVCAPWALSKRGLFRLTLNDFGSIFIVAILVIFGWWYLLMSGASYTNPVDAAIITTIGPIFTLITSIVAQSRQAKLGEKVGVAVALLGVLSLLVDRGFSLVSNRGEGYGNALVLCAVVAIAVNTVLISPVIRRHGAVVVMGWYYIIGTILALPLLTTTLQTLDMSHFTHLQYLEIAYILILGSALPMYLLYVGSSHLTPVHTAIYRYIQPIVATVVALARGQTQIDRTNIIGAVLIFCGMLCVIFSTPRTTATIRE
jgi:drug/metabolite transporter (DMT)-like permease